MSLLVHPTRRHIDAGGTPSNPPVGGLLGVGSASTSLVDYPVVQNTVVGDWYVDASRSSSGNGQTLATAFKTIQEGLSALQSGQTLLVKGGRYVTAARFNRTVAWATETRIMGYGSDRPIIDATGFTSQDDAILRFQGNARNETWHGFYIQNVSSVGGNGIMVAGTNIKLSNIWISHVANTGVYVAHSTAPTGITIQDCVVWRLGDGSSRNTNTGDCFAASSWVLGEYARVKFIRCVGVNGPDDGYDLWGGKNCELIDCVAYKSGYYWNGNPGGNQGGDGSAFKLGGSNNGNGNTNTVRGSIGISSRLNGFQHNHASSPAAQTLLNNTSYNNAGIGFDYGASSVTRSNLSFLDGSAFYPGSGGTVTNNSWQLGVSNPVFGDVSSHDYSLLVGSPAIGSGYQGSNLGASVVALLLAKKWLTRNLTGYANENWT